MYENQKKKKAPMPKKPKPSMLGSGYARNAADAIKKRNEQTLKALKGMD